MNIQRVVYASIIAICAGSSSVSAAAAQADSIAEAGTWLTGGSMGIPGYGQHVAGSVLTLALHHTYFGNGHLGPDLFVGTAPVMLLAGVLAVGGRANLVMTVPVTESVYLLPGAGLSMIGGATLEGGGGMAMGPNFGMSTLLIGESGGGGRFGVSWHRFDNTYDWVWLVEFGFVRARR